MSDNFDDKLAHPRYKDISISDLMTFVKILASNLNDKEYYSVFNKINIFHKDRVLFSKEGISWDQLADFISGCIKSIRKENDKKEDTKIKEDEFEFELKVINLRDYTVSVSKFKQSITRFDFNYLAKILLSNGPACLEDMWKIMDPESSLYIFGYKLLSAYPDLCLKPCVYEGDVYNFVYFKKF